MNFRKIPIRKASYVVICYMVLAFGWWAYLLWERNDEMRRLQEALLLHQQGKTAPAIALDQASIDKKWQKNRRIVIAEGLFFTGCLFFGLWVISSTAKHQVSLARQHRNFMLSITHELKSPIASIKLVLETLLKREINRDQTERICQGGMKDASRLQTLVEDLLLAARLENQWQPLPEPVYAHSTILDCVRNLETRFPDAHIETAVEEQAAPIMIDKQGFYSVIQNLLENAVKYAPAGAPISISSRQINGKLHIEVSDQGIGIPDHEKKSVFDKFYRIGNEDTRKNTGTGLGLYIVRQVLNAHKGVITVSDNKPRGTVFKIELPI